MTIYLTERLREHHTGNQWRGVHAKFILDCPDFCPLVRIWYCSTVSNSRDLPYFIFFWGNLPPLSLCFHPDPLITITSERPTQQNRDLPSHSCLSIINPNISFWFSLLTNPQNTQFPLFFYPSLLFTFRGPPPSCSPGGRQCR